MEVVVLLSVLVMITNIKVEARSVDSEIEESTTKDGIDNEEKPKEIIFKLPTTIEDGFTLTIRGTLQLDQSRFTAELPDLNIHKSDYCRITYNMTSERSIVIEATPPVTENGEVDTDYFDFVQSDEGVPETVDFILIIEADKERSRFKFTFGANEAGEKTLSCGVNKFEDIDHIVIKEGVQKIKSLFFEFE